MAGLKREARLRNDDPAIHVFLAAEAKDVDARHRRQVYAVCEKADYYGRA
jgi:hypothetical protein